MDMDNASIAELMLMNAAEERITAIMKHGKVHLKII